MKKNEIKKIISYVKNDIEKTIENAKELEGNKLTKEETRGMLFMLSYFEKELNNFIDICGMVEYNKRGQI